MYNSADRYYVVGTTHKDLYERPLCNTRYGYSEIASDEFCDFLTRRSITAFET